MSMFYPDNFRILAENVILKPPLIADCFCMFEKGFFFPREIGLLSYDSH